MGSLRPFVWKACKVCPRKKSVSLGISETYMWARLRRWFGQPRALNSSAALHGLRELPFMIHAAGCAVQVRSGRRTKRGRVLYRLSADIVRVRLQLFVSRC